MRWRARIFDSQVTLSWEAGPSGFVSFFNQGFFEISNLSVDEGGSGR